VDDPVLVTGPIKLPLPGKNKNYFDKLRNTFDQKGAPPLPERGLGESRPEPAPEPAPNHTQMKFSRPLNPCC
ncbi:MAG TPA: hypothetical protein VK563_14705, partial [Puia sp.]|nr:hypothetical protein [Puia sp.]